MKFISGEEIIESTDFCELVQELRKGFCSRIETPQRHHHDFQNPKCKEDSTLLLMPSWEAGESLGVKIVTVAPENKRYDLPSIHGVYILMDADTGKPKAIFDGAELTAKRTAAASALASSYLSRKDAKTLLMIGTGALAPNLIRAHISQRPVEQVWIWGRNHDKAVALAADLGELDLKIEAIRDLNDCVSRADIISCATLSQTPIINGDLLRRGQHIDLVGAYKPTMREADDRVIRRSKVFVDTIQGMYESGDILIPLETKVINNQDVLADLPALCKGTHSGRSTDEEITLFKSVGHASEDLIAANYFFNKLYAI